MQHYLVEYLFLVLGIATTFALPMLLRWLWLQAATIHDLRVRGFAITLAQAAQQMIPDTSSRYEWVASALAQRFPYLKAAQIQQLIESAVHVVKTGVPVPHAVPDVLPEPAPIVAIDYDPNEDESDPMYGGF